MTAYGHVRQPAIHIFYRIASIFNWPVNLRRERLIFQESLHDDQILILDALLCLFLVFISFALRLLDPETAWRVMIASMGIKCLSTICVEFFLLRRAK